jgi:hypothetical protein
MEEHLKKINDLVDTYESGAWVGVETLRTMLRELTAAYYHLTEHNIEYYQKHNTFLFNWKGSVASGKIQADEEYPELRMLRKIMEATENVMWSMKSELSIIKKES